MELDVVVHRDADEVRTAILQFVARRSYRLRQPWYLEGMRIEIPPTKAASNSSTRSGTVWIGPFDLGSLALFHSAPKPPRIDVNLKRKRGKTKLKISLGSHPDSTKLAYELHTYLLNEKSYGCECPPMCPHCGNAVRTVVARYCCRCGRRLIASDRVEKRSAESSRAKSPAAMSAALPLLPTAPPSPVAAEASPAVEPAPVVIERAADPAKKEQGEQDETEPDGTEDVVASASRVESADVTLSEVPPAAREAPAEADEPDELDESHQEERGEDRGDDVPDVDDEAAAPRRALAED